MAAVLFVIIIIVIVAIFSVQNAMPVVISFLGWQFNASLAVMALLFFLAGMVAGIGVLSWIQMRRKMRKKIAGANKPTDLKTPTSQT